MTFAELTRNLEDSPTVSNGQVEIWDEENQRWVTPSTENVIKSLKKGVMTIHVKVYEES